MKIPRATLRNNDRYMMDVKITYTLGGYEVAGLLANRLQDFNQEDYPKTTTECYNIIRQEIYNGHFSEGLWDDIDDQTRQEAYELVRKFFPDLDIEDYHD
jgi:hypothetical protein